MTTDNPAPAVQADAPRWRLRDAVVGGVAMFLVPYVLLTVVLLAGATDEPAAIWTDLAGRIGAVLVLLWWLARRFERPLRALLGQARLRGRDLALGLGVGVAAFIAVNVVLRIVSVALFGQPEDPAQEGISEALADPATQTAIVANVLLGAPLVEEVVFRGLLFRALRARVGGVLAALGSALPFALVHYESADPVALATLLLGTFVFGLAAAWLLERRDHLAVPIAAHSVFNGLAALPAVAFA